MSGTSWSEHPGAREDFLAVVRELPASAAERFVRCAERAIADIRAMTDAWPKVSYWVEPPTVRRRSVKPFRIAVVYLVRRGEVHIVAYAHEAREPGYWRHRVAA